MNGRTYDPTLGRFLQADPHIQAPTNSQNYNRYSYVLNNPMSYTDPSEYFFSKIFKKVFRNVIRASVKIFGAELTNFAGSVFFGWAGGAVGAGYWSYNFTRAIGGSSTGALRGALRGAFTAAATAVAFQQIGQGFNGPEGSWNVQGGAAHIAAHAVTGGVIADLQGGKFGHGFFAAGITKGFQVSGTMSGDPVIATMQSAIVGGTASAISGGKFANGAVTGAFQYLYNYAQNKTDINREKEIAKIRENLNLNKQQSRMVLNKFYSNDEPLVDNDITSAHIALATDVLARGIHATQAFLAISRVQAAIPFLGAPRAVQIFQTGVDLYSGGVSDWKDFFTGTPNYSNPRIANVIIPSVRFHHQKEYDELRGRY